MSLRQPDLFSGQETTNWKAPEVLPVLDDRYKRLWVDFETDGTDLHGKSAPVGMAVATEERAYYLPVGHQHGGNLDKGLVQRWANREFRGKTVTFSEAKFDIGMGRKFGIDFEALGCKVRELQFMAGLLDDDRRSFKLDDMAFDFLGKRKLEIDKSRIWELPASRVGPYAEMDVLLTRDLDKFLQVKIDAEELGDVLNLENDIIFAVCEMERNAARIDVPLLDQWLRETQKIFEEAIFAVNRKSGLRINPDSAKDLEQLFSVLGLGYSVTDTGLGSFTDKFLSTFDDPVIQAVRKARTVSSLRSKYLKKYAAAIQGDILRYKLHQMKGDEYGTISGRFSSSNVNIQQVFAPRRQAKKMGSSDFIIRRLFIPDPGMLWVKADAAQIEFRLFVHYSNSMRLLQAYRNNPDVDFHNIVQELLALKKYLSRDDTKTINFGKLYGMGRDKMAHDMELPRADADVLFDSYDQEFPEAGQLMREAISNAKTRGYVFTLLKRRARFPNGERLHSALNRVIQGSAADVMKIKIRDVYRERKALKIHKLRMTVHDELGLDMESREHLPPLKEFLDTPALPQLRVPLTWDVKAGNNWAML